MGTAAEQKKAIRSVPLNVRCPEHLHHSIKVEAAQRGVTLQELVVSVITREIRKARKKRGED